ncbi:MAG: DUF928 domain-containing protein [Rivularia sp. T60_A2020_040]|nr:DUF928 domain-containing protein [Rivularia sp. T60_A2020_040]
MNKIKLKLRSSILSATAFISLFSLTYQPIYAQNISPIIAFWNKIFKPIGDPEPPIKPKKGGSRGPICLISPDAPNQTRIIWNTKPLFLWKGDIKKIAVGIPGNEEYLTTQIVTGTQNANYTGKPLEPGQTYRWSVFLSEGEGTSPTMFVPFKIMETPQRNRITAELKLLERLQKNQGADAENIAVSKAEYFAQKGLWSDALQQFYSVPNPSPELSQIIKDIPNQLCKEK